MRYLAIMLALVVAGLAHAQQPVAVTVAQIHAAYLADPEAADRQFKDKAIRVSGVVVARDATDGGVAHVRGLVLGPTDAKNSLSKPIIYFNATGPARSIFLQPSTITDSQFYSIVIGSEIVLLCQGRGYLAPIFNSPVLDNCAVIPSSPTSR